MQPAPGGQPPTTRPVTTVAGGLLALMALLMVALPEYGFTRGRASGPRQIQYVACRHFPDCQQKPKKYRGESRLTRCRDHGGFMDLPVVRKQYG